MDVLAQEARVAVHSHTEHSGSATASASRIGHASHQCPVGLPQTSQGREPAGAWKIVASAYAARRARAAAPRNPGGEL
eukprot:16448237-Heterocapsa_arctica.AAC.1